MPNFTETMSLTDTAHVIQVALTPVFLLSGIGTLLNMFNLRMSRVADHAEHVSDLLEKETDEPKAAKLYAHMTRLQRRTSVMDTAIVLGGLGGAFTCAAAFALFVVTVREAAGGWALFLLFGAALVFTIAALMAFLVDGILAWHGIRVEGRMPLPKKTDGA